MDLNIEQSIRKLSRLVYEQDDYSTDMDTGENEAEDQIDPMLISKLMKMAALVQSIKNILEIKPLLGCRRRLYLLVLDLDNIYTYISDNKDNLKDKFSKIVKLYAIIVKQLSDEVKACLR